jgi:hypothetical protein
MIMMNLPSWQMLLKSSAVFNEEVGENSFSVSSRLVLGDTTRCSFKHWIECTDSFTHIAPKIAICQTISIVKGGRAKDTYICIYICMVKKTATADFCVTCFLIASLSSLGKGEIPSQFQVVGPQKLHHLELGVG